jgi:hypothetical protein
MRLIHVPLPLFALVTFVAPFLACAVGDVSPDVGPGVITPQSNGGDDAGVMGSDAGTPTPTPTPTPVSDDAGTTPPPPVNHDAGAPPVVTPDAGTPTPPTMDASMPVDSAPPPPVDSGNPATCPGYADPNTPAGCSCNSALHACTANGCYNGYYCELSITKCVPKPSGC